MEEGSRHSRSLRLVKGCETWFSRASMRSLSDLLVLPGILSLMRPGILSLILERHPLPPPPLLLLLPLSLAPPGCHPPFAMFRSPDIVCGLCHVSTLALDSVALDLHGMPRLRQPPSARQSITLSSQTYEYNRLFTRGLQSNVFSRSPIRLIIMQFVSWGISLIDNANSRTPSNLPSPTSLPALTHHALLAIACRL